jgi:hypothetical protein
LADFKSMNAITKPASPALPARRRPGKKVGRRSKFTAKLRARLTELIARGLTFTHSCAAVGISFASFSTYRNQHPDFCDEIEQAVAAAIERRLKVIEHAADLGDVNSAKWLLEHLHPGAYARNRLEVTGADGAPLAGAVAVYLPQKDDVNGKPVVTVDTITKELGNER